MYETCAKKFLKENLCALQVFLCALISRPVSLRTRARLTLEGTLVVTFVKQRDHVSTHCSVKNA